MLSQALKSLSRTVEIFDDHDEVLDSWRHFNSVKPALLHFDAHIDFEWISTLPAVDLLQGSSWAEVSQKIASTGKGWAAGNLLNRNLHLGNYLHEALAAKMFQAWYWIVPDPIWKSPQGRRMIQRDLIDLYHFRSGPMEYPSFEKGCFRTAIFEIPVFVSSLETLPEGLQDAVLSIDVDYLTTSFLKKIPPAENFRRSLPWIWPEEFHQRLKEKGIEWSYACIARSVRGGFTPIRYKFFAEILKSLLEEEQVSDGYFDLKKLFFERRPPRAEGERLTELNFSDELKAAFHYLSAQIHYEEGSANEAKSEYQQCLALDPEFATQDACLGRFYEQCGKWEEALKEYRMMRELMPDVPRFQEKEARCLLASGRLEEAGNIFRKIKTDSPSPESLIDRAELALKQQRFEEARDSYEKAAQAEPENIYALLGLARTQIKTRNFQKARESLRRALGSGGHFPSTYRLLAHVYRKLGYFRKALEFYLESWRLKLKSIQQRAWRIIQFWRFGL